MEELKKINYLRLSVTDRCNLNCLYCTPLEKSEFLTHDELLRYEEIVRVVKAFVASGIKKLRITGGEPLIKRNITELVAMLKAIHGLEELTLTTNGVYLKDMADKLKNAGLDRINISIDTLRRDRYKKITGKDCFRDVWAGIMSAIEAGLHPVKLNVVVMKGINDDEVADFARLAVEYPLVIRFVEFFPTTRRSEKLEHYIINNAGIKKRIIEHFGEIKRTFGVKGNGPAQYYKLENAKGLIGFISSYSNNFCDVCNRVRVDCAGRVSPCLFSGYICDLRDVLRDNKDNELPEIIKGVLREKLKYNKNHINRCRVEMSSIGG